MPTLTAQLLGAHLAAGSRLEDDQLALEPAQLLLHDVGGQLVVRALLDLDVTEVRGTAVQYVDHQVIQMDHRNADDHRFLRSAARKLGLWYSPPGTGISHAVHMELVGRPGALLLGVDSHSPAAGALGMIGIGAGGLDVAMALAGHPYRLARPHVWGIELRGSLPPAVSAKDVILELLRRHGVRGGKGAIIEYHGPGVAALDVWDRHVIASMGTELGATASVFPSDDRTRAFLDRQGRGEAWQPLAADPDAPYDRTDVVVLDDVVPLIARPGSPGDVVTVSDLAGTPIAQSYIGSSANPGYRDIAVVAELVAAAGVAPGVSLDINPASRQVAAELTRDGHLLSLVQAGARIHQPGCNGCIGMGQAPPSGGNSLRTVPRNFPGRSGTIDDRVFLVSPETAAASAATGVITDPRTLDAIPPERVQPTGPAIPSSLEAPAPRAERPSVVVHTGPDMAPIPPLDPIPDELEVPVVLALDADVSTDDILPGGNDVLPDRGNVPRLAVHAFSRLRPDYVDAARTAGVHAIVAGHNYGQGSSREHAALVLRHLGLRIVLARSYARIHLRNLANWGVLPLLLLDDAPDGALEGATVRLAGLHDALDDRQIDLSVTLDGTVVPTRIALADEQWASVRLGSALNRLKS